MVEVILPIIFLLINMLVQVLSFRTASKKSLLNSIFIGFFAGFFSLLVIEFWCKPASGFTNVIIYVLLGYCYFHFVGLSETARRIRMLMELYQSRDGLTLNEILSRYNAEEIVEKRLGRLISNGQLVCRDGKYFIGKPAVLFIAGAATLLKHLLLGRKRKAVRGSA